MGKRRRGSDGRGEPLGPDRLPISWVAAAFALLLGATMAFVPYELETGPFRAIYPSIRILGLGFLLGGFGMVVGAAWQGRPGARWADLAGRALFVVVLSLFWWQTGSRPGTLTGGIAFPPLLLLLVLELHPRFRNGGLWRPLLVLISASFAILLFTAPADFPPEVFGPMAEVLRPMGVVALAIAVGLVVLRKRFAAERWFYLAAAVFYLYIALCLLRQGAWAGAELDLVLGGACVTALMAPRYRPAVSLNTKLLRGMAVAGLLPLFAVGGLASYFAQHELELNLRTDIVRATEAEADWLGRELGRARAELAELAARDSVLRAVIDHDGPQLRSMLERVQEHQPLLEQIFVLNRSGLKWTGTGDQPLGRSFRGQDYFRRVIDREEAYVSSAYAAADGVPLVVVAVPIKDALVVRGVLGGALSLRTVAAIAGPTPSPYRVRVIDRRDERVLRDTGGGRLLAHARLPHDVAARAYGAETGALELFEDDGSDDKRRMLVAHAPVPGSEWVVLASQDVSSAYRPLTRVSAVVGSIVLLAGILAMLLSRKLARDVSRRVSGVTGAAQALAEGDLSRRADLGGDPDEVGTLARVFNDMAGRLQRGQSQLEHMNDELRAALDTRGELMEALRRSDRRKDEFLAMLAHELRNPLAALSGALAAMDRRSGRDAAAERLCEIGQRQIGHLSRLVDDLLDVSRITSNKITLRREKLDMRRALETAVEPARAQANARQQRLTLHLPPGSLYVLADAIRLEQVFSNLLNNALKYTDVQGQIDVRLDEVTGDRGRCARIVVEDNGRGIAPALLPNIFDLFVQGDITIDRSEGGLGLGLTLVRRLTEMHGGRVKVESAGPGQGSRFTVELPLCEPPPAPADAVARPQRPRSETPGPGRKVVLVDDNEDATVALKDFLEICGHAVTVAHDGVEGRDLILHEHPYLAFVDLGLPKMDGFEVARQVRKAGEEIRLVALTGYGDAETKVRAAEAGFDEHMVKPLQLDDIERLLA